MKSESTTSPKKITIEHYEGKADIIFTENVTEIIREETTAYQYDSYRVTVTDRANLETSVADNFEQWLSFVKNDPVKQPTIDERVSTVEITTGDILTVLEAII